MRLQIKIFLLFALFFGVFAGGLLIYRHVEYRNFQQIFNSRIAFQKESFQTIFSLKSDSGRVLAYDYSYWDDMMVFVQSLDPQWAIDNLEPTLDTFHQDSLWVFNKQGKDVYAFNRWDDAPMRVTPVDIERVALFVRNNEFVHFFKMTPRGIMEFHGAPVQPSADTERVTPAQGYFLAGRLLGKEYLEELSQLIGAKVSVAGFDSAGLPPDSVNMPEGEFSFYREVYDENNRPSGYLQVSGRLLSLKGFYGVMQKTIRFGEVFFAVAFVVLSLATLFWVYYPLRNIVRTLEKSDRSFIRDLKDQDSEFGNLARLINNLQSEQEQLQQNQEWFRKIFDNSGSLILSFDKDLQVINCNDRSRDLLGYDPAAVIGQDIRKFFPPEDIPLLEERIKSVFTQGASAAGRYNVLREDGKRIPMSVHSFVIKDSAGENLQAISILEDIRERVRMEEELQGMNKRLLDGNEKLQNAMIQLEKKHDELLRTQAQYLQSEKMAAVGRLSAGVAHEIKNPLAIISLGIEKIERNNKNLDDESRNFIRMIKDATDRANQVVHELLKFSRTSDLDIMQVNIQDIFNAAITLAKNLPNSEKITIETKIDPDAGFVDADRILLQQAVFNLVINSVDALEGISSPRIRLSAYPQGSLLYPDGQICICVEDNGCGMDPAIQQMLFEPFFTTKEEGKGTGLGLSTVFMIMEKHNGLVTFHSKEKEGTSFILTLPKKALAR